MVGPRAIIQAPVSVARSTIYTIKQFQISELLNNFYLESLIGTKNTLKQNVI